MNEVAVRVRLDLSYDGAGFSGWARQPGLRTVQGVLEDALGTVMRTEPPRTVVAGRTDAGVHARGQVVHVDVAEASVERLRARDGAPWGEVLVRRLAGVLPGDVVVRRAARAPDGFDARFSALRRHYVYRVADAEQTWDPLVRGHVLRHRRRLDVAAMDAAASALVGLHDFCGFCRPRPGATTIRTLEVFGWERPDHGPDAGLVVARVVADAFCHSMVRSLVGACLPVGDGRRPAGWPRELMDLGERRAAVAPAHALVLERVDYPDDADLHARAVRTRAPREAL